ncbi:MAG: hypothetical protein ACKVRN_06955 [Pyrinomonadaceae bacterium]
MKGLWIGYIIFTSFVSYSNAQKPVEIPKDWKSISGCGVKLYVPADVAFVEDQSVDTCERFYKGKRTAIHITATEWNVGQSDYSNWPGHRVAKLLVNEKKAEIVTSFIPIVSDPNRGLDFSAMLLVPDFFPDGRDLRIRAWSSSEKNRKEALSILKSVILELYK